MKKRGQGVIRGDDKWLGEKRQKEKTMREEEAVIRGSEEKEWWENKRE